MKMTLDEMGTMQYYLGVISGAVCGMGKGEGAVYDALEAIDAILNKAEIVTGGERE